MSKKDFIKDIIILFLLAVIVGIKMAYNCNVYDRFDVNRDRVVNNRDLKELEKRILEDMR